MEHLQQLQSAVVGLAAHYVMDVPFLGSGGALAVAAVATVTTLLLSMQLCGVCNRGRSAASVVRQRKLTVLLAGPPGGGKTVMWHKLLFGADVDSVMSMRPNSVLRALAGVEASPAIRLVDFPGAGQLRAGLLRAAADVGAIVIAVDSHGTGSHVSAAADLLYDVLTCAALVHRGEGEGGVPAVMVVATKADRSGGASVASLRRALEGELERLKVSRAAIGVAGKGGEGAGWAAAEEEEEALTLGRRGEPFSFDVDAPAGMDVVWGAASSRGTGGPGLGEVVAFILGGEHAGA